MTKLILFFYVFFYSVLSYPFSINDSINKKIEYDTDSLDSEDDYETDDDNEEDLEIEYTDNRKRFFIRLGIGFNTNIFIGSNRRSVSVSGSEYEVSNYISPSPSLGFDLPITESGALCFELGLLRSKPSVKHILTEDENDKDSFYGSKTMSIDNVVLKIPVYYRFIMNRTFNYYGGIANHINFIGKSEFSAKGTYDQNQELKDSVFSVSSNQNIYNIAILLGASIRLSESNFLVDIRTSFGILEMMRHSDSKIVFNNKLNFNEFNGLHNLNLFVSLIYDIKFGAKNEIRRNIGAKKEIYLDEDI